MLYYLVAFCAVAGLGAYAQTMENGACPSFRANSINVNQLTGKWYDWGRSSNNPTNGEKCGFDNWNKPANGVSKLVLSAYQPFIGHYSDVVADVRFISDNEFNLSFEIPNVGSVSVINAILETDYNNYVIYYACTNQATTYNTSLWIKTRQQYPGSKVNNMIRNALANYGLSYVQLSRSNQQFC